MPVRFFNEDVNLRLLHKTALKKWVRSVAEQYSYSIGEVNFIFCSDEHLLQINKEFLNHDYYTDIITFNQSEKAGEISADIYISVDRVKENSNNVTFEEELRRVMIHGVLHLAGFNDKTKAEKLQMREKENASLSLYYK